jgi:hypothetical protein
MAASAPLTCRQAQRLLTLGPGSLLPRPLALALAAHRDACPACSELGGEPDSAEPPPEPAAAPGDDRRAARRRLALRFGMAAALLAAANSLFGDWRRDPTLAVEASAGPVFVGGQALPRGSAGQRAWRSDLIETGPGGQARLRLRELTLELGPESELLVESVLSRRLRLCFGSLDLEGSGRLETGLGWLELEQAQARLEARDQGLRIRMRSGRGRWIDARGEQTLGPGVELDLEPLRGGPVGPSGTSAGDDP